MHSEMDQNLEAARARVLGEMSHGASLDDVADRNRNVGGRPRFKSGDLVFPLSGRHIAQLCRVIHVQPGTVNCYLVAPESANDDVTRYAESSLESAADTVEERFYRGDPMPRQEITFFSVLPPLSGRVTEEQVRDDTTFRKAFASHYPPGALLPDIFEVAPMAVYTIEFIGNVTNSQRVYRACAESRKRAAFFRFEANGKRFIVAPSDQPIDVLSNVLDCEQTSRCVP